MINYNIKTYKYILTLIIKNIYTFIIISKVFQTK